MKDWYDGTKPFVISRIEPAKAHGRCQPCDGVWAKGDKIAIIEWPPYQTNDWARMHPDCAINHPMNMENIKDLDKESDRETGTQRDHIEFLHTFRHVEAWFNPSAPRDKRYTFRAIRDE